MQERIIGIRHRVKATKEGEARPTQVAILENGEIRLLELGTEQEELDFVFALFADKYREVTAGEDLSPFRKHQVRTRGKDEAKKKTYVPASFEGLRSGDTIAMVLGGSGDNFAFALARRAEQIGAKVVRIPAISLKDNRGEVDKNSDASLLATLAADKSKQKLFYQFRTRDADLVNVREAARARSEAQKERIACEGRLRARTIGAMFRRPDGLYPEGTIEDAYDELKASDPIYQNLLAEEKKRTKELEEAVNELDIYQIFDGVEGCGPAIAARIISTIVDIRRFPTKAKLRAFLGVHVTREGKFPRRRRGAICNWNPTGRQGMYLLGDQFVKRKDSVWGLKQRDKKIRLRIKHPEVERGEGGKKRYTDAHIHKMAYWWAIGKFAEWLFKEWWKMEDQRIRPQANPAAEKKAEAA